MIKKLVCFVCAVIGLLCPATTRATPIIVYLTGDGFIAGTNDVRSDGSRTCKLHYTSSSVLLMSSDISAASVGDAHLFDLQDDLWDAFHTDGAPETVIHRAIQIITATLWRNRAFLEAVGRVPDVHLLLLSYGVSGPVLAAARAKFDLKDIQHPKVQWITVNTRSGDLLVWVDDEPWVTTSPNPKTTGVAQVEDLLEVESKIYHTPAWSPPFVIALLNRNGFRVISGDASLCLARHPIPPPRKSSK
jgi:hypothetical protein